MRRGEHRIQITVGLPGRLAASPGHVDGRCTLLRWLNDAEIVGPADMLAKAAWVRHQPQRGRCPFGGSREAAWGQTTQYCTRA